MTRVLSAQRHHGARVWLTHRTVQIGAAAVVAVGSALAVTASVGNADVASLPGLRTAGAVTGWALPAVRVLADGAGAVTVGLLLAAVVFAPVTVETVGRGGRSVRYLLSAAGYRSVRYAAVAALVWLVSVAALLLLTVSDLLGMPIDVVLRSPATIRFLTDVAPGRALLVSAVAAVLVAVVSGRMLYAGAVAALGVCAIVGVLAPAFAGHAASAGEHRLAVSSLVLHAVAAAGWMGGLAAVVLLRAGRRGAAGRLAGADLARAARRFSRLAGGCFVLVVVAGAALASTRLDQPAQLWTTAYGRLILIKIGAVVTAGVLGWWHRRVSLPQLDQGRDGVFARIAAVEVVLLAATFGVATGLSRTPPPVAGGEDTVAQALLGFPMPGPVSVAQLLGGWLVEPLSLLVILVAIGGYLAGWWRLYRRGVPWPVHRAAVWTAGWLMVLYATNGGLARYAPVLFSVHMVTHLLLGMLAPILVVLGAPVTLALRALRPRPGGRTVAGPVWPGPREWLSVALHSGPARLFAQPLVAGAVYVGSLFVLYFTGLYELSLRSHLAHLVVSAHFLIAGYLFFHVLIGVDPGRRPAPYPLLLMLLFGATTLHAVFGLVIQQSTTLLAADWYQALARPWGGTPLQDQRLGGSIAWSFGELPSAAVAVVLLGQWWRADQREARRIDRDLDRAEAAGEDNALAEYNRQLAAWAREDALTAAPDRPAPPTAP